MGKKASAGRVGIVGAGPSGMMAALALSRLAPNVEIVMFEQGPIRGDTLKAGETLTDGWGGAGAFSDGKYNLDYTGRVGGRLTELGLMTQPDWERLVDDAGSMYIEFGGDAKRQFGKGRTSAQQAEVNALKAQAEANRLEIHDFPILHLGTSTAHQIVSNIHRELLDRGVEIRTGYKVERFAQILGHRWVVIDGQQDEVEVDRVICCPGRSGADWFERIAPSLEIPLQVNGVDIGVRVETSNATMRRLTDAFYESKIYHRTKTFHDRVRTFCMCPSGFVVGEEYRDTGIFCANGHTDNARPTDNTNFAVLVTQMFTEPFKNPHFYGRSIAESVAELAGRDVRIIVQRLGDIIAGRRSTDERILAGAVRPTLTRAMAGDLSCALPYRIMTDLLEFMAAMDTIAPGVGGPDTLFYGPEIKWAAIMAVADPTRAFMARPNFHVAGDGVGYTRGLNGASAMGVNVGIYLAHEMAGADISNYRDRLVKAACLNVVRGR